MDDLFPDDCFKGWAGVRRPRLPPAPLPPAPPYLAVLQAVLLLGGWDDFQGDGPLGLRLKGKRTQPYHLPDLTLQDVTSYFPDLETHVQKQRGRAASPMTHPSMVGAG